MREDTLGIPESFRFWLDGKNLEAMEHVAKQKRLPASLAWNEVTDFYKARFAAALAKHEFYLYLHRGWEATWGVALPGLAAAFEPVTSEAYDLDETRPEEWLSPEAVWNENAVHCVWKMRGGDSNLYAVTKIFLATDKDASLRLGISVFDYDSEKEYADTLTLDAALWQDAEELDENGYRCTSAAAEPNIVGDTVSLAALRDAAKAMIAALAETSFA